MTFDDLVPEILAEEQAAGVTRLHDWLAEQATWLSAQLYHVGDAELRERYLALRGAVEAWLWPAPAVVGADTAAYAPTATDSDLVIDDPEVNDLETGDLETGDDQDDEQAEPSAESAKPGTTEVQGTADGDGAVPPPPPPGQLVADALDRLWQDIAAASETARYAAAFAAAGPGSREPDLLQRATCLWKWIHLVCLRVPADIGEDLRARAREAVEAVGNEPTEPDGREGDFLIPPLPTAQYAGADVRYQPPTGPAEIPVDGSVERMVGIAVQMTWLAWHDPAVRVGWEVANSGSTLVPFTADHLGTYNRRIEGLRAAPPGLAVTSLIKLDELIRGVVPLPLPAKGSWWWSEVAESGRILVSLFGNQVTLPEVGSPYQPLLGDTVEKGCPVRPEDAPEVGLDAIAWVLRARSEERKGRVAYVSDP